MRIELTIDTSYRPGWAAYEGLRELLQNGYDASIQYEAPLSVRYRVETQTLVIENDGCSLSHEALLLGNTTKEGRPDLIGKFGDGLKIGVLGLLRSGNKVKIRTGDEVWVPSIEKSEKFDADLLTFDIQKRTYKKRVQVEIGGVDQETWDALQPRFLFLKPLSDEEHVLTINGTLLLTQKHQGQVFCKGIYVMTDPKLAYGYDLSDCELDIDRKMVHKYDLQYRTQLIWKQAMAKRPDLMVSFVKLLDREAADVDGIDDFSATYLSDDAKKAVLAGFVAKHGEGALPVSSLSDSHDVEHLGKRGIVCPKPLRSILEQSLGNVAQNKAKLATETTRRYGWHEMTPAEKANLEEAIALVNAVEKVTLEDIEVCDFRDPKLGGLFTPETSMVSLAKDRLMDPDETLLTLVHEVAHRVGGDGEKNHVARIERIWATIVKNLRKGRN